MKILVFGSLGMLGRDLMAEFNPDCDALGVDRAETDIARLDACLDRIRDFRPEVIVNAAALTHVDYCETHEAEAVRINGEGAGNLAKAADSSGALLVHYSTDYVFDGLKPGPYLEGDAPNPLSVYGKSKLLGEERVRKHCPNHLILRISWLFGPNGANFIEKIMDAAKQGKDLRVVEDQKGSPTYTRDVAAHTRRMIRANCRETYHLTNQGTCTRYELAVEALKSAGMEDVSVAPVSSGEFNLPAPRPCNSVLENDRLKRDGLPLMRPWQNAVKEYVRGLLEFSGGGREG
ncbi:MAG: dTDP-4-dehydrorhamnose reductase [Acidobacteria bacterium]|nr:dTDP-4-dehydrorhamnose reductase [Acidobacteriota bacterium]